MIRVWWAEKFGQLPAELAEVEAKAEARVYLLTRPDLPWQSDPLRENPADRGRLFERYLAFLDEQADPYAIIEGEGERRFENALSAVRRLMPWLSA